MQMHRTTFERDSSMGYHMWFERENNTNKLERSLLPHNTLCLSTTFCISYCLQMLLGGPHIPQKHVKTMFYTKFGRQTWHLMWNLQIMKGQGNGKICSLLLG